MESTKVFDILMQNYQEEKNCIPCEKSLLFPAELLRQLHNQSVRLYLLPTCESRLSSCLLSITSAALPITNTYFLSIVKKIKVDYRMCFFSLISERLQCLFQIKRDVITEGRQRKNKMVWI